MQYIPLLKQILKYPIYYDDDLKNIAWKFNVSKNYDSSLLRSWKDPVKMKITNLNGPGEMGVAVTPTADMKSLMERSIRENHFNLVASNMMSSHRALPDMRSVECQELTYPKYLPTTSIIIIFHNEAWSLLLRTLWSIIDRTPPALIHEVILVDDNSTYEYLKRPLEDYIETLPARIRVIRTLKREGLIRARMIGAEAATVSLPWVLLGFQSLFISNTKGSILTFFDAHMECTEGWLQPILARIASDRSVVAVPMLDWISSDSFQYQRSGYVYINGFWWSLIWDW